MQQNSAHFEEGIVRSIQSAWATFAEWQARSTAASQELFAVMTEHMASAYLVSGSCLLRLTALEV